MLPQIKLIQAVDRLFPKQSGQQKYGSSKKKKKKERSRGGPLSGSELPSCWKEMTQEQCMCAWVSHLSRPEKLHSLDIRIPG